MASNSKFEFVSLELEAEGILGQDQAGWRFQEVVLRPRLTIAQTEDNERGNRLLHKAEKNCLVARSLACPVVLDPVVIIAEQLLSSF
jgi:organic hydroperoxide reductase OsmC/OhrA